MNKITKFEDLIAWQKARELTRIIYTLTRQGGFTKDYGLASKIQRAAFSITSNIAKGFERGSRADFHRFIVTAKGSCAEVRAQLYVALDNNYLSKSQFESVLQQAEEVSKILGGLRASLARQRDQALKV